jgi:hypothetical protein
MISVNERNGREFRVEFYDQDHIPTLPETVYWRLDCATTKRSLSDWASVSPVTEVSTDGTTVYYAVIEVPASSNVIQQNRNSREVKKLLVVADKDTDREYSDEYEYVVVNLQGRS